MLLIKSDSSLNVTDITLSFNRFTSYLSIMIAVFHKLTCDLRSRSPLDSLSFRINYRNDAPRTERNTFKRSLGIFLVCLSAFYRFIAWVVQ